MGAKIFTLAVLLTILSLAFTQDEAYQRLVEGNHNFTAAVYKELKENENNFIVSPLSAETVLALTSIGAKGDTFEELAKGLFLPNNVEQIQSSFEQLNGKLSSQKQSSTFEFYTANKIYISDQFNVSDWFINITKEVFNSEIENIDFSENEEAAQEINTWVEDHTEKKIKDLVESSQMNADTKLILVNALYFYGQWEHPFSPLHTLPRPFYNNGKDMKLIDSMRMIADFNYYEDTELDAKWLELPYVGGTTSLTIVLPNKKDGLPELEKHLDVILERPSYSLETVQVTLPKFQSLSTIDFLDVLKKLGVEKAFSDEANFSGISETEGSKLYVNKIIQKAFIDVAENGTEAAAASAVSVVTKSGVVHIESPNITVTVDHPFIYLIIYENTIAMAGRIVEL